jgi:sec-independent protein translocase protein TatC
MSKYFIEIRNRLSLLLLTWFSTIFISYLYKEILLFSMVQPNTLLDFGTGSTFFYFIFTNVTEIFSVYLQLVLFLSFQVFVLGFFHHMFSFSSPSLFNSEYFYLNFIRKTIVGVWFFSVILLSYILVPLTWNFFLSFQNLTKAYSFNLHFEAKLDEYLNFYVELYYLSVLYCQIFTALFLFLIYTNTNIRIIRKFRKLNYYFFVIFSTLISPPDILSQVFISITTIALYEILLFIFIFRSSLILLIRQPIKTD